MVGEIGVRPDRDRGYAYALNAKRGLSGAFHAVHVHGSERPSPLLPALIASVASGSAPADRCLNRRIAKWSSP